MNRFVVIIAFLFATVSAWAQTVHDAHNYNRSDINNDGTIDITDINIIINIMLGNDNASNYNGRADVTGDGITDVSDLNAIVNIMLNN